MLDQIKDAYSSWIDALTEVILELSARLRPSTRCQARLEDGVWTVQSEAASASGRDTSGNANLQVYIDTRSPHPVLTLGEMQKALKGADIRIDVPTSWMLLRTLEPMPKKTLTYLDAFIRQHLEKLAPWHPDKIYYSKMIRAQEDDASKVRVDVAIVSQDMLAPIVAPLMACAPRRLTLAATAPQNQAKITIDIALGTQEQTRKRTRGLVNGFVAMAAILTMMGLTAANWRQAMLDSDVATVHESIATDRAFLSAAMARRSKASPSSTEVQALRNGQPPVVEIVEKLSALLPDEAYLTDIDLEKNKIRITGIAQDIAPLIPDLERKGGFADVSFFAPTTRLENEPGFRFYLQINILENAALSKKAPQT